MKNKAALADLTHFRRRWSALALAVLSWLAPSVQAASLAAQDAVRSAVPAGVVVEQILGDGSGISIQGTAASEARIAAFLRAMEQSELLESASVSLVKGTGNAGDGAFQFDARVKATGE